MSWDLAGEPPRKRDDSPSDVSEFFGGPSGPAVLLGTYTVRLTVDGEVHEQPVEVDIDPTLEVAGRDLRAQHRMATEVRDLISVANDGLRSLAVRSGLLNFRVRSDPSSSGGKPSRSSTATVSSPRLAGNLRDSSDPAFVDELGREVFHPLVGSSLTLPGTYVRFDRMSLRGEP